MAHVNIGDIIMGNDGYVILSDLGNLIVGDGSSVSIPPASKDDPYLVLIAAKAQSGSAFAAGLEAKDMFIHSSTNGITLSAGDQAYISKYDRTYPCTASSINTEPVKTDVTTQKDGTFKNEKETGWYNTPIELSGYLEKGNELQKKQLQSVYKTVTTAADGSVIVKERQNTYAFLLLNYLDGQNDANEGIGCVVRFEGAPVTKSLEDGVEWAATVSLYTEKSRPTLIIQEF